MTHVDEDYLLCGYGCVTLAEINAVFKSHVVLGVAAALFRVYKVVNKRVIVMIALNHDAVEIFEVVVAVYGIRDKHDTFLCRCVYQKAVIWHVVGRFKWLDGKSSDERFFSHWEGFYAPN
jgi:hypothetical protein